MMHTVPMRGADGKIVELVDPRALEEKREDVQNEQPEAAAHEEDARTRRSRALRPEERKPLRELLGSSPGAPHANRSFTTGMVAGLLGALIVAALIVLSHTPASDRATLATSAPATVSAPTSAASAPVVVIAPTLPPTVGRALVAYAAPEGAVVGAISADRAISLTGTFGSAWVQIETADSGQVWVKQVDLPAMILHSATLADLPDLAPPPTATALPAPTSAPVARPLAPAAPASAPASVPAPIQHCTPDRVVAIVERGVTQIASCVSLADALASLPGSTVVAQDADAAQTYYEQADAQATALAQPSR